MSKFSFNKKKLEDTWDSGKEKVNEQIQIARGKNYGKGKIIFFILLLIVLLGLGFYFNIIQNIFYSFLSIIVIVLVLALGIAWEYVVFTYVPLYEIQHSKNTATDLDPWKKLEHEFEIVKINSEQKIKQIKRYSIINYMTSIGLFIFSCIVLLIDWIYDGSSSLSPYQEVNPALALSGILVFFSLIFMLLHYLNQRDITKKQEKFFITERWILSIKSAHLLGKDPIIEELIKEKNI